MIRLLSRKRHGPIGVDIGARCVKLLQLSADHGHVVEAAQWDLPSQDDDGTGAADPNERVVEALRLAREGRAFRGREAVLCIGPDDLFLQNLRVPKGSPEAIKRAAEQEAASRLPYAISEAELRLVPVADVRQQDAVFKEVLLFACHKDHIRRRLELVEQAGLRPVAVDIEPAALLRSSRQQHRREEDRQQRVLYVHLGYSKTAVVIAENDDALFVKYIDVGGRHLDEAVAEQFEMDQFEATSLRRHNGDRRTEQQDPEINRMIAAAVRPVLEKLAAELAMCLRYHSVTFRGRPLDRMVLGGGEATGTLAESLGARLNLNCEMSDPLRTFESPPTHGRAAQWDVAAGLALKTTT
jgi:type IV pilus assembly protein PilM